jgi:hypothetical protein
MNKFIFVLVFLVLAPTVSASIIGYNLTNDYLHVWNNGTVEPNYYYYGECLDQVANEPDEYWEIVDKWISLKTGNTWHMDEWNNENPCVQTHESDFLTYSNNTVTTDIHSGPLKLDLEMKSHIKTNDDLITQIYSFEADHTINQDVWFMLRERNIQIAGDQENDYLILHYPENSTIWNGTDYIIIEQVKKEYWNLSHIRQNNLTYFMNSSHYLPYFFINDYDKKKNILNDFQGNDYEWKLKVDGNISLFVNLGEFSNGEKKYFEKQWVDAMCACIRGTSAICFGGCYDGTTGCNDYVGDWLTMRGWAFYMRGFCTDCHFYYQTNQTGSWNIIQKTPGYQLRCNTTTSTCVEDDLGTGGPYSKQIMCEKIGQTGIRIYHQASICGGLSPNSVMGTTNCGCWEHSIRLISPENNSEESSGNITFSYNFTEMAHAPWNCSLLINNSLNETSTDVEAGVVKDIGSILGSGIYNWSVNCTGIEELNFPRYDVIYDANYSEPVATGWIVSNMYNVARWSGLGYSYIPNDDWEIINNGTWTLFNLTNPAWDGDQLRFNYTQGQWEEWNTIEGWLITVVDEDISDNWILAISISFFAVAFILIYIALIFDPEHWLMRFFYFLVAWGMAMSGLTFLNHVTEYDLMIYSSILLWGGVAMISIYSVLFISKIMKSYKSKQSE